MCDYTVLLYAHEHSLHNSYVARVQKLRYDHASILLSAIKEKGVRDNDTWDMVYGGKWQRLL
jgi:hypothetical protein